MRTAGQETLSLSKAVICALLPLLLYHYHGTGAHKDHIMGWEYHGMDWDLDFDAFDLCFLKMDSMGIMRA